MANVATAPNADGLEPSVLFFGHVEEQNISCRTSMEDRILISDKFGGMSRVGLFGIFDGHGGDAVSEYIATKIKKKLRHNIRRVCPDLTPGAAGKDYPIDGFITALYEAVTDIEQKLAHFRWAEGQGSTLCIIMVCGNTLIIASIGDSRAVMGTTTGSLRLTRDHKPTHMVEVKRIHEHGGTVISGRVLGVLNVSRAIGDTALKPYVSAEPDIFTYFISGVEQLGSTNQTVGDVGSASSVGSAATNAASSPTNTKGTRTTNTNDGEDKGSRCKSGTRVVSVPHSSTTVTVQNPTRGKVMSCEFVIMACDGLWDVLLERDAVEITRQVLQRTRNAQAAAQALVDKALENETKDNVSVIVIVFNIPK